MHQLTRLLAKNCGPVRVNCVAPGLIETRITAGNEPVAAAHESSQARRAASKWEFPKSGESPE